MLTDTKGTEKNMTVHKVNVDKWCQEQGKMKVNERKEKEKNRTEIEVLNSYVVTLQEEVVHLCEPQMFSLRNEQDTYGGNSVLDHSMEERLETKLQTHSLLGQMVEKLAHLVEYQTTVFGDILPKISKQQLTKAILTQIFEKEDLGQQTVKQLVSPKLKRKEIVNFIKYFWCDRLWWGWMSKQRPESPENLQLKTDVSTSQTTKTGSSYSWIVSSHTNPVRSSLCQIQDGP